MNGTSRLDRARLAKILSMLGSSHPGEVVAAANRAVAMLREAGMDFDDVVGAIEPPLDLDAIEARHRESSHRESSHREGSSRGRGTMSGGTRAGRPGSAPRNPGGQAPERDLAELRASLATAEALRATAETRCRELEDERHRQDRRLDALAAQAAELQDGLAEAREELLRVRLQLAEVENERRRLRRLLEQAGSTAPAWRHNADKRSAVLLLLSDPATAQLSDRELARRAGVSPQTVGNIRRDTEAALPKERKAVRNGKVYTMRTSQIGRKAAQPRRKGRTRQDQGANPTGNQPG